MTHDEARSPEESWGRLGKPFPEGGRGKLHFPEVLQILLQVCAVLFNSDDLIAGCHSTNDELLKPFEAVRSPSNAATLVRHTRRPLVTAAGRPPKPRSSVARGFARSLRRFLEGPPPLSGLEAVLEVQEFWSAKLRRSRPPQPCTSSPYSRQVGRQKGDTGRALDRMKDETADSRSASRGSSRLFLVVRLV